MKPFLTTDNWHFSGVWRIAAVFAMSLAFFQSGQAEGKISRFGEYRGFSKEKYEDYVRRSDYMTLSDGTRLAYDLLLPAVDGNPVQTPLPVLFSFTPYLRAYNMMVNGSVVDNEIVNLNLIAKVFIWFRAKFVKNGHIFDQAFMNKWLSRMLKHGYAVVIVEQRGTGASEGTMMPIFKYQGKDANEVIDWIATQSWSNDKIGMFGKSSVAMAQYAAASANNPHLKAIFPVSSSMDMYSAVWFPGGILNRAFAEVFSYSTGLLESMAVPVDSDTGGSILRRVLKRRSETFSLDEGPEKAITTAPYRDSESSHPQGGKLWEDLGIYTLLDQINQSETAIYNETGWFDIFLRDGILLHLNLTGNRKLLIRPLSHFALGKKADDLDTEAEAHRWFDYWLKGMKNGIMSEPAIHYYVMQAPVKEAWKGTPSWPPKDINKIRYFLAGSSIPGLTGQRGLRLNEPKSSQGFDTYRIDYTTTTGKHARWDSIIQEIDYPDMLANDSKSMSYTSEALNAETTVIGHPVVHLVVATKARDLDIFVYLEEVKDGGSQYVTEGMLRASHRQLVQPGYLNMELPFNDSRKVNISELAPGQLTTLKFDLLPTAYRFRKGSRIRLTIACADADNFRTPKIDPAPEVKIFRDNNDPSFIELPVIQQW